MTTLVGIDLLLLALIFGAIRMRQQSSQSRLASGEPDWVEIELAFGYLNWI